MCQTHAFVAIAPFIKFKFVDRDLRVNFCSSRMSNYVLKRRQSRFCSTANIIRVRTRKIVFIDAVKARYVAELLIPLNIVVLSCKLRKILAKDAGDVSDSTHRACGQVALI